MIRTIFVWVYVRSLYFGELPSSIKGIGFRYVPRPRSTSLGPSQQTRLPAVCDFYEQLKPCTVMFACEVLPHPHYPFTTLSPFVGGRR